MKKKVKRVSKIRAYTACMWDTCWRNVCAFCLVTKMWKVGQKYPFLRWVPFRNHLGSLELGWLFVSLEQGTWLLFAKCFGWHLKPSVPCACISEINTVYTLKNVTGYSKRAGDHPGTVDCASKTHSSTLHVGSRVKISTACCLYAVRKYSNIWDMH